MRDVGKNSLLSTQISKARALLLGGVSTNDVLIHFQKWRFVAPVRGTRKTSQTIHKWAEQLTLCIEQAIPLGSSIALLLQSTQPMVRQDEKFWQKLQSLERQFGFQGAIALVLPWVVAALSDGIHFNFLQVGGALLQLLGAGVFTLLLKLTLKESHKEEALLFDLLVKLWMRVLSGISLHQALQVVLNEKNEGEFSHFWKAWLHAYESGGLYSQEFEWSKLFPESKETSSLLFTLLKSGAPAAQPLSDLISHINEERQARLEEKVSGLPVRASLVFCLFFTPAVFSILLGGLWPTLKMIMD